MCFPHLRVFHLFGQNGTANCPSPFSPTNHVTIILTAQVCQSHAAKDVKTPVVGAPVTRPSSLSRQQAIEPFVRRAQLCQFPAATIV